VAQEETSVVSREEIWEVRFAQAKSRVDAYLSSFGGRLLEGRIVIDETLDEHSMATHYYPDVVVIKTPDVPESVIAHEWVHVVQQTLESFRGFRLLHVLLAEGLAEFVTKELYPDHSVKYPSGYELVAALVTDHPDVIRDLLRLNELALVPEDIDMILANDHVPPYSKDLLGRMADHIQYGIRAANKAGIDDPTFVTLGEEVRAWKFLLDRRFDGVREKVNRATETWFEQWLSHEKKADPEASTGL
jgi:hypothetical protein